MVSENTFRCATCGRVHDGLPEVGFRRPDAIIALSKAERAECFENDDICVIPGVAGGESRHFLRCHLSVPLKDVGTDWGWGVWVEISEADFEKARELWDVDGSAEAPFRGVLANAIVAVPGSSGSGVTVQLGDETTRPGVHAEDGPLARLQREGVTLHDVEGFLELK
jgi:hypothetical protein